MKPTLSRNEKDVVDHKITQPHQSRLGRSKPTCSADMALSLTTLSQQRNFFFYYSCQGIGAVGQGVSSMNTKSLGNILPMPQNIPVLNLLKQFLVEVDITT